jgi:DNA topoisomerase-1
MGRKTAANGKVQNNQPASKLLSDGAKACELIEDPKQSAKEAGLRYVTDSKPGITRRRHGKGFSYVGSDGKTIRDAETLARIRSLVIPPAWEDVWICSSENGHLQATGYDARRRKQYRYHPQWRVARDKLKYDRMIAFAHALPGIRKRVKADLARKGLPREKVLAGVVHLLEATLIRVGNDEYAKNNGSFGLTTMLDDHVEVNGSRICFEFCGKSGKEHEIDLTDRRLARIVAECQELPGQELFQFLDDEGQVCDVNSDDVNDYLREISDQNFTAKDFRTWAATVLAARALQEFEDFDSQAAAKRNVLRAIEHVASRLGNTKAVCRKCYIHPAVIDAYMDQTLIETMKQRTERELREHLKRLPPEEAAVMALLQQRMQRDLKKAKSRESRVQSRRSRRKGRVGESRAS